MIKSGCAFFGEDFFYPTDDAAGEANFYSVRMGGGLCENILNDSLRQFACALVLFLDNLNPCSRFNIGPVSSTHLCPCLHRVKSSFDSFEHYDFNSSIYLTAYQIKPADVDYTN